MLDVGVKPKSTVSVWWGNPWLLKECKTGLRTSETLEASLEIKIKTWFPKGCASNPEQKERPRERKENEGATYSEDELTIKNYRAHEETTRESQETQQRGEAALQELEKTGQSERLK